LSARALAQADNVRKQLEQTMERFEVELVSLSDPVKLYQNVRQALVCGFFMQVAHKEGEKGNYLTVENNQVCFFIPFYTNAAHTPCPFPGSSPPPVV
jgi:pre-mRNA-splicing factor ATP-dependent RNA helicase DHX15/PRP43